jgi:hypothetical protein
MMSTLREEHVYDAILAKVILAAVLVVGFVAIAWYLTRPFGGCAIDKFDENQKLALNVSADIVKLLLALSTVLVAFGGTVLLGLKESPKLTVASRVLILASTCCFAFSAYFALLWHSRLAQVYYASCPGLITQWLEVPFIWQTNFLLFGLALIGFLVLLAIYNFPFASGFATSRALSIKRRATVLSVRCFKVTIPIGGWAIGSSTGKTLNSVGLVGNPNTEVETIVRKRPDFRRLIRTTGERTNTVARG